MLKEEEADPIVKAMQKVLKQWRKRERDHRERTALYLSELGLGRCGQIRARKKPEEYFLHHL